MTIAPFGWQDSPSTATPVDTADLEAMLQAAGAYTDQQIALVGSGGGGGGNVVVQNLGNVTGSVTVDLSQGIAVIATVVGNTTFSFINWPAAPDLTEPILNITQDVVGGHSIAINGVTWIPNSSTPTFPTSSGVPTVISLSSPNQGTTIYGYNPSATRSQVRDTARGLKGQVWDLTAASPGTNATATSQTLYGTMAGFVAGDVVTSIYVCLQTAAVGATPTDVRLGIFSKAGAQLATTANLNSNSAWLGTGYIHAFPLTTPFVTNSDTALYLGFWKNGVWGTTEPTFAVGNDASAAYAVGLVDSQFLPVVKQTGQTSFPTNATLVADTQNMWFGWT